MQRDHDASGLESKPHGARANERERLWHAYAWGIVGSAIVTGLSYVGLFYLELADVVMIFLLGVVVIAARLGLGPSLLAAGVGVLAFDYFVIPPVFHFSVAELKHVVTLAGMFSVAIIVSGLTERLRNERERARRSERRTSMLYALERELAAARHPDQLAEVACRHLGSIADASITIFVSRPHEEPRVLAPSGAPADASPTALDAARRTIASASPTWPSAHENAAHLALVGAEGVVGAVALRWDRAISLVPPERELLEACCRQVANALDRMHRASEAERARLQIETERVRSALLSAVSHDLRTPLAMISASAQMLVRAHESMTPAARGELLVDIAEQVDRLDDLLRNLVAMTRVETGGLAIRTEPGSVPEVVASSLRRSARVLGARSVEVHAPRGLPLVAMDASLLEQVFVNLLENAARYSPRGAPIEITIAEMDGAVVVDVDDHGPGVPEDELDKVFEKFYRGRGAPKSDGGLGLGLAICRAIVVAHGGSIQMKNREGGGAAVRVALPASGVSLSEAALRLPELAS